MRPANRNILKALELSRKLLFLADRGDMQRDDTGCGVLYGIMRDAAWKIKTTAERECEEHRRKGTWERGDGPSAPS